MDSKLLDFRHVCDRVKWVLIVCITVDNKYLSVHKDVLRSLSEITLKRTPRWDPRKHLRPLQAPPLYTYHRFTGLNTA